MEPVTLVESKPFLLRWLLSWVLFFRHIDSATSQLKSYWCEGIRYDNVLYWITDRLTSSFHANGRSQNLYAPGALSIWDISAYYSEGLFCDLETEIGNDDVTLNVLSAHVYFESLRLVPSAVRLWWDNCKDNEFSRSVEKYGFM
jgi:hypothetical protein